jgi:fucose 4-O-acetylase-like acetyltransferase
MTPPLQGKPYPHWLPSQIGAYLWDANPMGSFPLLPWLAYALTGCFVGSLYLRFAAQGRLATIMAVSAVIGAAMALAGQIVPLLGYYIYYPTPAVPVPAYPASYVYRTGMCLLFAAVSYWYCLKVPSPRFSPLRVLGQASLLVYIVHIELVYGVASWWIHHRLSFTVSTVLIVILSVMMIALAFWRVEVFGRRKKKAASKPAVAAA